MIGPYDLYFATYYHENFDKTEHVDGYFNYLHSEHEAYPTAFQVACVMGIIKDCLRYHVENETVIKVDIPGTFFEDEQNRVTTDLSGVLDELQNMYDYYQMLWKMICNLTNLFLCVILLANLKRKEWENE